MKDANTAILDPLSEPVRGVFTALVDDMGVLLEGGGGNPVSVAVLKTTAM